MAASRVQQFFLRTLVPILLSVVAGLLFYQEEVFSTQHSAFQFLWNALIASAFYHLLAFTRFRDALLGLILLFVLTLWTTHSTAAAWILRDVLYVAAIGVTILLYVRYFRSGEPFTMLRPAVTLAGLYGIVYLVAAALDVALLNLVGTEGAHPSFISLATSVVFWGSLIGFALGAGLAINDKLFGAIAPQIRGKALS